MNETTPPPSEPDTTPAQLAAPNKAVPTLASLAQDRYETLRQLTSTIAPPPDTHAHADPSKSYIAINDNFVHDLRVAIRRLKEVVRLMQSQLTRPAADAIADTLSQALKSAGELRDLDVLAHHIAHSRLPAGMHPLRQKIMDETPKKRPPLVEHLRAQLTSPGFAQSLLVLARSITTVPHQAAAHEEKLRAALQKRLKRRRKQLRDQFARATKKQTPTAFHQSRIAAKKLRYALELARDAQLADCKNELRLLKQIQSLLGDMHDTDVIAQTLHTHLDELEPKESKKLNTPLTKWLRQTQKKQSARAAKFFAKSFLWMNNTC